MQCDRNNVIAVSPTEVGSVLEGIRIVILAEDDFENVELMEPLRAMRSMGARVTIVGSGSRQSYQGKRGTATVTVDAVASEVRAEDFDAIIVPGRFRSSPATSTRAVALRSGWLA